jgi:2-polyprenyl-6-methoxyphenol hydroxylase-like FAD-dependent oxidoreductase
MYSVFQFEAGGDVPQEGRLTLESDRVGGYWPLPDGRVRFSFPIASAEEHRPDAAHLRQMLASRTPWFSGTVGSIDWTALGLFERKLATSVGSGRVWMAGDAIHLTGPLGGQSMNVGLREGEDLASRIARVARSKAAASILDEYAASRAAEWRTLFGANAPYGSRMSLLLPCLPASGPDLDAILAQLNS